MSYDQFFEEDSQGLRGIAAGLLMGLGLLLIVLITIGGAVLLLHYEHPAGLALISPTLSPLIVTATPSAETPAATLSPTAPAVSPTPGATYWAWPTAPATPITYPTWVSYPTSGPCPPPPYRYWVYIVQRGDTLSSLARQFDTSIGVLMQINCLLDARIYAGQPLRIPGYPPPWPTATIPPTVVWPTPTPWATATPGTPTATAITTPETPSPTATPGTPSPTVEPPTVTASPEPSPTTPPATPTSPPTEPPATPTSPPTEPPATPTSPPTEPPATPTP